MMYAFGRGRGNAVKFTRRVHFSPWHLALEEYYDYIDR